MADVTKGTNFYIVPKIDRQSATAADAAVEKLVKQAVQAVDEGNDKLLTLLNQKMAKKLGQANPEVTVKVGYDTSSATGEIKKIKTLSASALDPMIKSYKKMVDVQGESALAVKKELNIQRDKLNSLKQQGLTLRKHSKAKKENLQLQKALTGEIKRMEGVLQRVTTLSSLKGQLREESQKLSMMSEYNMELDKQGKMVSVINKEYAAQKTVVQGLSTQVNAVSVATKGFGARIAATGQAMQAAFGWIAAALAGLTAIAGSIGMITGRAKDIQAIKLTFDGLGQSIEAQNAILDSAKNIALSYGVSLRKIEGAFRRLGPAVLEAGGTLKDTEGAIKSIAARTTMLGLNTEQTGRYIEAFAQVMGKGKLQSEELNQQFSELDGGLRGQLKNWLAANKGITDFEGAMKRGEITSGLFLEAFEAINEEIRNKFLRSIGDTQQAISKMGSEGGMTINQLNAKLQTLTSIGLESVGKALAPLGKELMKIYAAFVQVFTKIATEMPGIQALFQGLGHVLGTVLKVALNSVIVLFGVLMSILDKVVLLVMDLYQKFKDLPGPAKAAINVLTGGMSGLIEGLEKDGPAMNDFFDSMTDGFSKLSDKTIGAGTDLEKYNDAMANLKRQFDEQKITEEQYHAKKKQLEDQALQTKINNAQKELDIEQAKYDELLAARNKQLERDQQIMDRKIDGVNKAKDAEVNAIDETIAGLEKQKAAIDSVYDGKIAAVKRAAAESMRAIEAEIAALNSQKAQVKAHYESRIEATKNYYSQLRSEMDAAHAKEMGQMDARMAKLRASQSAESAALDNGPEKRKLDKMKILELNRQIASETDEFKRQELKAEVEMIEKTEKRANLERRQASQMAALQKQKAALQRKQAEEKKALDEEEKLRVKELQESQKNALQSIANALQELAVQKKEAAEKEKADIEAIKTQKEQAQSDIEAQIAKEEEVREKVATAAEKQIERLKAAHQKERQAVEDVEWEMSKMVDTQGDVADAVDNTTNGALDRQLKKVKLIKREMAAIKAGGGGTSGARFAGGPVSGGSTYTVNELGTEGFLSASGKMSEIKAPSFGSWRAPSSGSVIPAHIWQGIKANQATQVQMPSGAGAEAVTAGGTNTSRALSAIAGALGGDTVTNNVTIQSANPNQTASNVLVELAKLKRLRYN